MDIEEKASLISGAFFFPEPVGNSSIPCMRTEFGEIFRIFRCSCFDLRIGFGMRSVRVSEWVSRARIGWSVYFRAR